MIGDEREVDALKSFSILIRAIKMRKEKTQEEIGNEAIKLIKTALTSEEGYVPCNKGIGKVESYLLRNRLGEIVYKGTEWGISPSPFTKKFLKEMESYKQ